jgi:hypothetical protein
MTAGKVHSIPRTEKPAVNTAKITKSVVMKHKKSTKGTHVYEADSELCSQVYLGKGGMGVGDKAPLTVTVHVEFES